MTLPIDNKVIFFCTGAAGLFLPPTADFLYLRLFSLPSGRRGWGVTGNIRELALEISPDTHGRIGRSPEKPQIFLYLLGIAYSRYMGIYITSNAYG